MSDHLSFRAMNVNLQVPPLRSGGGVERGTRDTEGAFARAPSTAFGGPPPPLKRGKNLGGR
jgi:hypothetical protein